MKIFGWWVVGWMLAVATLRAQTNTYSVICDITNDGSGPTAGLVLSGGTLYGTIPGGGASFHGMFAVGTNGSGLSSLIPFGSGYGVGLILNGDVLYGFNGTFFTAYTDATNFTETNVGNFSYVSDPVLSDNPFTGSHLYGTIANTAYGGMIYKINTDGTSLTNLRTFTNSPDGAEPQGGLVMAGLGGYTLYGTTYRGGSLGNGTVYKINMDGTGYAIIHNFTNTPDGANPQGDLVLNGNLLYGTTCNGGGSGSGTVFVINTNGTGCTILYSFTNLPDGANPEAGLLLIGTTLYGTTCFGGTSGYGTVFEINTNGTNYAVLHSFLGSPSDGARPDGNLITGNGILYGTTSAGGIHAAGTIFTLTLPTPPVPPPPPLQVTTAGKSPAVFWQNDGLIHTLQTTTNLASGPWTTVSNGVPLVGLQITNAAAQPQAFYRLQ
jgi:uncharacterized repeat protein (TIGR03803 family)